MTILPTDPRGAGTATPVAEGGTQTARPDHLAGGNLIAAHASPIHLSVLEPGSLPDGASGAFFPSLSGGGVRHPSEAP
jgi:hypothetical protein